MGHFWEEISKSRPDTGGIGRGPLPHALAASTAADSISEHGADLFPGLAHGIGDVELSVSDSRPATRPSSSLADPSVGR